MCQNPITKRWFPVKIKALCPEPRSYQVEMLEGITYRRNTKPYKTIQVMSKDSMSKDSNK